MSKKQTLKQKIKAVKTLFPQATLWGINNDGSIDFTQYAHQFGRIRLFCCTHIFHGKVDNLSKVMECANILGANEYSIKPSSDGNNWVELYYRMRQKEITKQQIIDKEAELNILKSTEV